MALASRLDPEDLREITVGFHRAGLFRFPKGA
jgi:hypothetical protein